MIHEILRFALDPRVWLGFGVVLFGGIVGIAEITQRREIAKKRREQDEQR